MKKSLSWRFRPGIEALETREVPAFLATITSTGGGINLTGADFNQDGRSDVAVIRADNTVAVRLSNDDGTFTQSAILKGARGDLYTLSVSDRNSDGILDIVASGTGKLDHVYVIPGGGWGLPGSSYYTGTVYTTTWLGKGDGTFGKATMRTQSTETLIDGWPSTYVYPPTGAMADFNSDGIIDRAFIDASQNAVTVRLGNADGSFQPPQSYSAGANPGAIAVGDFNGDGWTDIVVVNNLSSSQPTLTVLLNAGNW